MYRRTAALAAAAIIAGALALPSSLSAETAASAPAQAKAGAVRIADGPATPSPAMEAPAGVEVSIRFYDKRVYRVGDSVPVKVTISNKSAQTWRFKLAEERVYSVAFEARSQSNRALEVADDYKKALAAQRPVFYREVAVNPGEEYSFVEDAARYVRASDPGSYTLRASFWPELLPQAGGPAQASPLASNVLILALLPSSGGMPPAAGLALAETGEIQRPLALPPDEVVSRTLVARQRSRWNEFFLYLDIEALLSRNESRKRAYDRESDEGRRRMIERYKADLETNVVDVDIVTIPTTFEILETRYSADSGYVKVLEKFQYRGFTMVKEYDYELARRDGVWYIEGYTVLNKGTE